MSEKIYLISIYWLAINFMAIILFGIDKSRARRHVYRISEATLFTVALLGGSVGAWIGMYVFRHKTAHKRFVLGIPFILALQLVAVLWYMLSF